MTTSFVTIRGDHHSGWDVIQNTFPKISGSSVSMSIVSKSCEHFEDEKTVTVAAKKMAELNHLQFVPNNTNVITVTPFFGCWMPIELTSTGNVIGQGTNEQPNILSAITEAKAVATTRGLPYVGPDAGYLQSRVRAVEALDLAIPSPATETPGDRLKHLNLAQTEDFAGVLGPDVG